MNEAIVAITRRLVAGELARKPAHLEVLIRRTSS